jgi:hypothetical protein
LRLRYTANPVVAFNAHGLTPLNQYQEREFYPSQEFTRRSWLTDGRRGSKIPGLSDIFDRRKGTQSGLKTLSLKSF